MVTFKLGVRSVRSVTLLRSEIYMFTFKQGVRSVRSVTLSQVRDLYGHLQTGSEVCQECDTLPGQRFIWPPSNRE